MDKPFFFEHFKVLYVFAKDRRKLIDPSRSLPHIIAHSATEKRYVRMKTYYIQPTNLRLQRE